MSQTYRMSDFEQVPFSLTGAIESLLYSLRNHPMSEDRVRDQLNELHLIREAIARIDPEHPQSKSLPSPFFPPCAYKAIPLPDQCHLARLGYLENSARSSIDDVLPDRSLTTQLPSMSESFYLGQLEEIRRERQKTVRQEDSSFTPSATSLSFVAEDHHHLDR